LSVRQQLHLWGTGSNDVDTQASHRDPDLTRRAGEDARGRLPPGRQIRASTAHRLSRNAPRAVLYVAKITRVAARFRAEFPDIGEWSVLAATEEDAVAQAKRALSELLRQQILTGRRVSQRRYRGPGPAIEVDGQIALAIQLREARTEACLSTADLGERAGVGRQVVEDLEAALTVPTLDKVLLIAKVLGARPVIEPDRPGEAVGLTKGKPRGW
jgi:DNA-binding XRE family transcriptional regulator